MLCVIPYHLGDRDQAVRLANWIRELGEVSNHDCLLVVDRSTTPEGVIEPLCAAFKSVTVTVPPAVPASGWGNGTTDATAPNEMWLTAAWYVYHKLKCRWFWLEADAVPTRSTWLDEIEAEDKSAGKPFMGARVDIPPHELHMSGIAVYPPDVCNHSLKMMQPGKTAWDYAGRADTVKKAHFTDLIQHVYRIDGAAPTFPTIESLSAILPGTAVFHRCKDLSLHARFRERAEHIRRRNAWLLPVKKVEDCNTDELQAAAEHAGMGFETKPTIIPRTWIGEVRERVMELSKMVDSPSRRHLLHVELREARLIGEARRRKKK